MKLPERLRLAHLPTPIIKLERLSGEFDKEIYLWRDDCTGFLESGNKIRKLEFVLADALKNQASHLITCGGPQSNHVRATVVLAKRLGLPVTIVMREPKDRSLYGSEINGNLLLDHLFGAEIIRVSFDEYRRAGSVYDTFLKSAADQISSDSGKPYIIPEGASSPLGCFGYIAGAQELVATWQELTGTHAPDSVFCALGSGGTFAGLAIGFECQGIGSERLWAVNICDDRAYFERRVRCLIDATVDEYQLPVFNKPLQILDGHVGLGYAQTTPEELRFYMAMARKEGVLFDPVYTGKAFRGMLTEIQRDPKRFGKQILFLHSGGTLATFAYASRFMAVIEGNVSL